MENEITTATKTQATGYGSRNLQYELDLLDLRIANARNSIAELEGFIARVEQKRSAAEDLLATATVELAAGAPRTQGRARADKREAEVILAECAEDLIKPRRRLQLWNEQLAAMETQRTQFPHEELRAQQRLEALRRNAKRKRS